MFYLREPIVIPGVFPGYEKSMIDGLKQLYQNMGYSYDGGEAYVERFCCIDTTLLEENIAQMLGGSLHPIQYEQGLSDRQTSSDEINLTIQAGDSKEVCWCHLPLQGQMGILKTHLQDIGPLKTFLRSALNPSIHKEEAQDGTPEHKSERAPLTRRRSLINVFLMRNLPKPDATNMDVWADFRKQELVPSSARGWQEIEGFSKLMDAVRRELVPANVVSPTSGTRKKGTKKHTARGKKE
jgi:hypothetical protein